MINYYLPIVQVCTNIQQHHHACTTSMSVCRKLHYFSQLNKPIYFIDCSTSKTELRFHFYKMLGTGYKSITLFGYLTISLFSKN